MTMKGRCSGCEVLMINGLRCHETGCPEAWKEQKLECGWCGARFLPKEKGQRYCCDDCFQSDCGLVAPGEEE